MRIGSAARTVSAIPPEPDLMTQLAGLETLNTLAVTEPLRAVDARMPLRRRRVDPPDANNSGLHRLASGTWEQKSRLAVFAINGMNVFAVGLLIQVILVRYASMGHISSYIAQALASVQMNFLLSRYLTWRDRNVAFLRALARFNAQQFPVTGLGIAGYAGLERLGMNYIAANVAVTAALTSVSFLSSHKWLMTRQADPQWLATDIQKASPGEIGGDDQRGTRRPFLVSVPLLTVLALQTVLSLRLIWSKTAFNDEALYLWAGHLELAHILHGTPTPSFQTYFSGAPVIYLPLGALADSLGGLAAARMLSLAFMLGATVLLFGTTQQLFGRRAGEIAAGSFGLLGSAQFLGAFATYDAMAVFLLALAARLVVMARRWSSEPLLIAAGLVLALADATKYPTILWDPVVIALAALTATQGSWLRRSSRAVRLALYTSAAILVALLRLGGHSYLQGIMFTTLARESSRVPAGAILRDSALWVGLILVIALRGLVIADSTRVRLICATLACAVVLAPLEQARIHTQTSLDKHVAFGAWFGAIAVGYVLDRAVETSKYMGWRIPIGTIGLIALMGIPQASSFYSSWPNAATVIATMQRLVAADPGAPILAEQGPVVDYYLGLPPRQLTNNTGGFWYWDPLRRKGVDGTAAYLEAIQNHYFSVIELDFSFSTRKQVDQEVLAALRRAGGYHLVTTIPWTDRFGSADFDLWEYQR